MIRKLAITALLAISLVPVGARTASADSSWKCQTIGVDVVGGRAVCAQAVGSGLDLYAIRVVLALDPNAEADSFLWRAEMVGGPNNDWFAEWPIDGEPSYPAYTYGPLPTGTNYTNSWDGVPYEPGGGIIAQRVTNIETPGGVLTVLWRIDGYVETTEGPVPATLDSGSISFNVFSSSLSPA